MHPAGGMKMRKIVCLHIEGGLRPEILEECSRHSFLVEPRGEEILIDLSSFQQVGEIIGNMADTVTSCGQKARIGLAASPLLAIIAADCYSHLPAKSNCHRFFYYHGVMVIQVLPGREADFLNDLPLEQFPPLSQYEKKVLKRMGYTRVGELGSLSAQRLTGILKRDASLLAQNCQGIDYTSVKGLYPPDSITYALAAPGGCRDLLQLQEMIRAVSVNLGLELWNRRAACRQIRLELITPDECVTGERILPRPCHDTAGLQHILNSLIPLQSAATAIEEIRAVLAGLQTMAFHMPDIFTWRELPPDPGQHIKDTLYNLQQKYPDSIQIGIIPERREQILSFWDPWRLRS
jgi:hypothetical protein